MELLWECSLRATLIAVSVWAVTKALGIRTPSARHRAWCGVLTAILLLPAVLAWAPKAVVPIPSMTAETGSSFEIPTQIVETGYVSVAKWTGGPAPLSARERPDLVWMVYLLGTGVLVIRLLSGTLKAASLLRRATPEQGFLSSSECASPVTIGRTIVLPTRWRRWPVEELQAVLAHEREHVRRLDSMVQWLGAVNRCIFWFHPLAWWIQRRLSALAEEACDAAVVASGHSPHDYAEYLLNQARSVRQAGGRLGVPTTGMGGGDLSARIQRVLDGPAPSLSRSRAACGGTLCISAIAMFVSCQPERFQKAAPGQLSMNELMHKRAAANRLRADNQEAIMRRARSLTGDEAKVLVSKLHGKPDDDDTYWTLVRYYEHTGNQKDRHALWLWYIEHHPLGGTWPGNIDPRADRVAYEQGRKLWMAHVRGGGSVEVYLRAAAFLEGGDKPLAGEVLQTGQTRYPKDPRWAFAFGRHYAQALLGATEPLTEFNVFRTARAEEAQSLYAQSGRARLASSTDARLLLQTAQWLLAWGITFRQPAKDPGFDVASLVGAYVDRALEMKPDDPFAHVMKLRLNQGELVQRGERLLKLPPAEHDKLNSSERLLLAMRRMHRRVAPKGYEEAVPAALEVLDLAAHNKSDAQFGDALFEANITLGKAALRRGDKKASARYLLAAADTPGSDRIRNESFEMNLPRALVDVGQREAVAQFLDRMASKTVRSVEFRAWASGIRKGTNPDLIPTLSVAGCSNDPC